MKLLSIDAQSRRILAHLLNGGQVTSLSALTDFGCLRLSGRIFELREQGYPIVDEWVNTPSGKRLKRYFIAPDYDSGTPARRE